MFVNCLMAAHRNQVNTFMYLMGRARVRCLLVGCRSRRSPPSRGRTPRSKRKIFGGVGLGLVPDLWGWKREIGLFLFL